MSSSKVLVAPISVVLTAGAWCVFHVGVVRSAGPQGLRVLYDEAAGKIHVRGVQVPPGELTLPLAERLGREFAGETAGSFFSNLLMVEEENDLVMIRGTVPRPESAPSFDETRAELKSVTGGRGYLLHSIARTLTIGGSALLSYRAAGYGDIRQPGVQEVLLAGSHDPTLMELKTGKARLLNLAAKSGGMSHRSFDLALFFKSASPSCAACEELADVFQKQVSADTLDIQIRTDSWFASLWFPLFFPFEPDNGPGVYDDLAYRVVPPKVDQYYRSPNVECYRIAARFSCDSYGLTEHVER
jgi:hypothetical protein